MTTDITIEEKRTKAWISAPYYPAFTEDIRTLGEWSTPHKVWQVPLEEVNQARQMLRRHFGRDDQGVDGDRFVDVRINLTEVFGFGHQQPNEVYALGQVLIKRSRRGGWISTPANVQVVSGRMHSQLSVGLWREDPIIEVKKVPMALAYRWAEERQHQGVRVLDSATKERSILLDAVKMAWQVARGAGVSEQDLLAHLDVETTGHLPTLEDIHKHGYTTPLTGSEAQRIREHVGSRSQYAKMLGVSRGATINWEQGAMHKGATPALLRLLFGDVLRATGTLEHTNTPETQETTQEDEPTQTTHEEVRTEDSTPEEPPTPETPEEEPSPEGVPQTLGNARYGWTCVAGELHIITPYNERFVRHMRDMGGRWDRNLKHWVMPVSQASDVRETMTDVYGVDPENTIVLSYAQEGRAMGEGLQSGDLVRWPGYYTEEPADPTQDQPVRLIWADRVRGIQEGMSMGYMFDYGHRQICLGYVDTESTEGQAMAQTIEEEANRLRARHALSQARGAIKTRIMAEGEAPSIQRTEDGTPLYFDLTSGTEYLSIDRTRAYGGGAWVMVDENPTSDTYGIWWIEGRSGDGDAWGAYNGNRRHGTRIDYDADLVEEIKTLDAALSQHTWF